MTKKIIDEVHTSSIIFFFIERNIDIGNLAFVAHSLGHDNNVLEIYLLLSKNKAERSTVYLIFN